MAKYKKDNVDSYDGLFKGICESEIEEKLDTIEERKKGRPKEKREVKKRVSFSILPSIYDKVGKIAYVDRESISEVIAKCLIEYIEKNSSKIIEYDKIKDK